MGGVDRLSEEELSKLRSAAFTDQERAIIEILLNTDCKRDELIKIQKSDIEGRTLSVDDREIYLNDNLKSALDKYLQNDSNSKYLFHDKTGKESISLPYLSLIIRRIFKRAGIEKNGHTLRNTYISNKLDQYEEAMEMSNGDWIRSMSDEELAEFLKEVVENFADNLFTCEDYKLKYGCMDCDKCYLEWVKQSKGA